IQALCILLFNIVPGIAFLNSLANDSKKCLLVSFSSNNIKPGFVQNCPTPILTEPAKAAATFSLLFFNVFSISTTGFMELISAYTGIGSGLLTAAWNKVIPMDWEPVNPTALIIGCSTNLIECS